MLSRSENPLIYEVCELSQEPIEGMFNVGCTVIYPGKIGDEYYFAKWHFHQKESASEVYVGMEGVGVVLMQDHLLGLQMSIFDRSKSCTKGLENYQKKAAEPRNCPSCKSQVIIKEGMDERRKK